MFQILFWIEGICVIVIAAIGKPENSFYNIIFKIVCYKMVNVN